MKLLLLDNYDSFTYNLLQLIENSGIDNVKIVKNDKILMQQISDFDAIVLSPGPDLPAKAGKMMQVIAQYYDKKPILGVCLGFQAICQFFGAKLVNLPQVLHGLRVSIDIDTNSCLYKGFDNKIFVGLYHSWAIENNNVPQCLEITAYYNNIVMSVVHKYYKICAVQYHPESFMTDLGQKIFSNWLKSIEN